MHQIGDKRALTARFQIVEIGPAGTDVGATGKQTIGAFMVVEFSIVNVIVLNRVVTGHNFFQQRTRRIKRAQRPI